MLRHKKICLCNTRTTKEQISLDRLIITFIFRCPDSIIHLVSNPKFQPSFCGCAGWFVSYLVANSEDRVSLDEAHILQSHFKRLCYFTIEPRHDKTNKVTVRLTKTQISLGIRPVWSESSLCSQWVAKDPSFLHADNEDVDQTGRMPRLIWVFAGHTLILLVLSCRGSIFFKFCPNLIWL